MNTVFDLDKLEKLLRDFYAIAHVRITVFDAQLQEIVAYPREIASFCRIIRATEPGRQACVRCDREGCARALQARDSVIYQCHAGLTEAATPLFADNLLIGYLLIGHVFAYESHAAGWQAVEARCRDLPVDRAALRAACDASALLDQEYIRSAAQIMHAVASYLVLERMAGLQEDQLAARLNALVSECYADPIGVRELCEALRDHALEEFGPLALLVLTQWGVYETSDFGRMVYALIGEGVFGKNQGDQPSDFEGVYDFEETFARPYDPPSASA